MSIVLLAGLLASGVILTTIVVFCLRGEFRRASQTALRWAFCAAAYAAILVVAAMTPHDSALKTGEPYCDDDMCMSVESVTRTPVQAGSSYRFAIRLFTRANHGPRSVDDYRLKAGRILWRLKVALRLKTPEGCPG